MALRAVSRCRERLAVLCRLHSMARVAVSVLEVGFMRCCLRGLHKCEVLNADMTTIAPKRFPGVQRFLSYVLALLAQRSHTSNVLRTAAQQRIHIVNIMNTQAAVFFNKLDILLSFFI